MVDDVKILGHDAKALILFFNQPITFSVHPHQQTLYFDLIVHHVALLSAHDRKLDRLLVASRRAGDAVALLDGLV